MDFTREEFDQWWHDKVTREVIAKLVKDQEALKNTLVEGTTLSDSPGLTAQLTARLIGEIAGLEHVIKKEFLEDDD